MRRRLLEVISKPTRSASEADSGRNLRTSSLRLRVRFVALQLLTACLSLSVLVWPFANGLAADGVTLDPAQPYSAEQHCGQPHGSR